MHGHQPLFNWAPVNAWCKPDLPAQPRDCPCCDTEIVSCSRDLGWERWEINSSCPLCGWTAFYHSENQEFGVGDEKLVSILQVFAGSTFDAALTELARHLSTNFNDVYTLSWGKFEGLVQKIFQDHGFNVLPTQPTKDGGADLLLLEDGSGSIEGILDCKKWAANRTIGVEVVRTLVGAAVDWEVGKAYLVTSTRTSREARRLAASYRGKGYEVDLVAGSELLSMLQVYNTGIPRLEHLSKSVRDEMIAENRRRLKQGTSP